MGVKTGLCGAASFLLFRLLIWPVLLESKADVFDVDEICSLSQESVKTGRNVLDLHSIGFTNLVDRLRQLSRLRTNCSLLPQGI